MILRYYNKKEKTIENYPNVVCCMMASYNEFMITFINALGYANTRRLKIDENHYFKIETID